MPDSALNLWRIARDLLARLGLKLANRLGGTMELVKYETIAVTINSGVILLSAALGGAHEGRQDHKDSNPVKVRIPFRYNPAGDGMTAIDPPSTDIKPSENHPSNDKPRPYTKQPIRFFIGY
jgi:hypothetical protein